MRRALIRAAALCCVATAAFADEFDLTILHTNDFHARFEPITDFGISCPPETAAAGVCLGGAARLATAISEMRARPGHMILLDGGDQFQGSLFYTYYKGALAARMMTAMRYDAMTLGNHEFDDGPDSLRGFLDAVDFPVLMTNADVSREPRLAGQVQGATIIERGGERIGLIGIAPQNTPELSRPGTNIVFTDPVSAVRRQVSRLEAQGVNKIIVLSHSGYLADQRLAAQTEGVDVIVGGHSHTYLHSDDPAAAGPYPTMVGETAIVQTAGQGRHLGVLSLRFDASGVVISAVGAPLPLDGDRLEEAAIKAQITEAALPLDALRRKVVAETKAPIDGRSGSCRQGVCAMGVTVAEAMLARVRAQGVEVALTNGGGLRAGIDAGPVTMEEVLNVLPFQNTLSTFTIRGAQILAALENGVSAVEEGSGRFPQVAGMRFRYDPAAPPGARVRAVTIAGVPLERDRAYRMVSNDFLRAGGDGYTVLREVTEAYDFGPDLADVLIGYLAGNTPFAPYVDDRIIADSE